MTTATTTEAKKTNTAAPTGSSGSSAIAAQISQTNAALEAIRSQQAELLNDERRAEAEAAALQQQLTEARAEEQAAAHEAALSDSLKALKAKAKKLNTAAIAMAELYEGFKADYSRYLNSLSPEESQKYYGMGGQRFSASSLPYVTGVEAGADVLRIGTVGQSAPAKE